MRVMGKKIRRKCETRVIDLNETSPGFSERGSLRTL